MIHVLANHKVNDYKAWKTAFDSFAEFRKSSGEQAYHIWHTPDNPNDLTLLFQWDSLDNAKTFMLSDKLKTAMQEGGVVGEPNIQFLQEAEQGALIK